MRSTRHTTSIVVAAISAISVLGATLFSQWDKVFDKKPSTATTPPAAMATALGGTGNVQIGGGNAGSITINNNMPNPDAKKPIKLPEPSAAETDYRKLVSPATSSSYIGKEVLIRLRYLGEWTITSVYKAANIDLSDRVFLNHRSVDYSESNTAPFGSSSSELPPFPISVSMNKSDVTGGLHPGDFLLIKGRIEKASQDFDFAKIHLKALEVSKLASRSD